MDASAAEKRSGGCAPGPARFHAGQLLLWLTLCGVLGGLGAWIASAAQAYHPPFLLFSLMTGVLLGGMTVWLLRICSVGHRATLLMGAALAGGLAALGQHYLAYWRAEQLVQNDPDYFTKLRLGFPEQVPPDRFWEFMEWGASRGRTVRHWQIRGAWAWVSWGAEALLVLAPTILLTLGAARLPYCNQSRNWYQSAQSGRIGPDAARQLGAVVDVPVGGEVLRARYRLIRCPGGCGPTGLWLLWEESGGEYTAGPIWLGSGERERVEKILDEAISKRQAGGRNDGDHADEIPLDPDP